MADAGVFFVVVVIIEFSLLIFDFGKDINFGLIYI